MIRDLRTPPWTVTCSQLAYIAPGLALFADQVIRTSDGHPGVHHRLVEPEGVRVVAVTGDGDLALVWRWRPATATVGIELPSATTSHADRTPLDTARRALREDCGLAADTWTDLGETVVTTGTAAQRVTLYLAHNPHRAPQPPGLGDSHPLALPYTIITAAGAAGPITDAASLSALHAADRHRLRGDWHLPTTSQPPAPLTAAWPLPTGAQGTRHRSRRRPRGQNGNR